MKTEAQNDEIFRNVEIMKTLIKMKTNKELKQINLRRFSTPFHLEQGDAVHFVDPCYPFNEPDFRRSARVRHDKASETNENNQKNKSEDSAGSTQKRRSFEQKRPVWDKKRETMKHPRVEPFKVVCLMEMMKK